MDGEIRNGQLWVRQRWSTDFQQVECANRAFYIRMEEQGLVAVPVYCTDKCAKWQSPLRSINGIWHLPLCNGDVLEFANLIITPTPIPEKE